MSKTVLLTGATGHLGPHVLEAALAEGWHLRVATPDAPPAHPQIEWVPTDFLCEVDYPRLVAGCSLVIHLAAQLAEQDKMERVNIFATGQLAAAAEAASIETFVYTSSVGVYGFPHAKLINEKTPVLDIKSNHGFLAPQVLYDYCITKLGGEDMIRKRAKNVKYIIARPANIVNEKQIEDVLKWPLTKQIWRSHRYTHQIYVKDVAASLIFLSKWASNHLNSGNIEVFNTSNDDLKENTYGKLHNRFRQAKGMSPILESLPLAQTFDILKDCLKYGCFDGRLPAGLSIYSPSKLMTAGFIHPHGILKVQDQVIHKVVTKANDS